ncbi:MAG: class I SAM-dependent methyltransferase [Deltaproteobacteria bacterium]|nr:MAG: class I SAM-dependent methyltransferase [Deltaproteobacteria bacterium]
MTAHGKDLAPWLRRLAVYRYAAAAIDGKRVLELSCGAGRGAAFLADLGASRVVGVDEDRSAVAAPTPAAARDGVDLRAGRYGSLEFDDGAFDVVIVPDGAPVLRRRPVVDELRRVLAADGCLIAIVDNADRPGTSGGMSYFELGERLEPAFSPVRLLADAPFVAASIVEFAGDDAPAEVELDTALRALASDDDDDVAGYVAVCGPGGAAVAGRFAIVQLPTLAGVAAAAADLGIAGRRGPADAADVRQLRARLHELLAERAEHAKRVEALKAQVEDAQQETGRVAAEAGIELNRARRELSAMRKRVLELEAKVAAAEEAAGAPAGPPAPERIGAVAEDGHAAGAAEGDAAGAEPTTARLRAVAAAGDGAPTSERATQRMAPLTGVGETPDGRAETERIAEALAAHAAAMRAIERELAERTEFAEELRAERDAAAARADELAAEVARVRRALAEKDAELRRWRTRASLAEGELVKLRRALPTAAPEAAPVVVEFSGSSGER